MRTFTLTVTTLCLAALTQGYTDYHLKCERDEIGIRWPSYHSNSDYYVCTRIGGKQIKMSCQAGELFTFVLQSCTAPGKFIPPPPMDILPTSSTLDHLSHLPSQQHPSNQAELPKPFYPSVEQPLSSLDSEPSHNVEYPKPPNLEIPAHEPQHEDQSNEHEESDNFQEVPPNLVIPSEPVKPSPPAKSKPSKNTVTVPVPPTPEPTPPVVKKQPGKKQTPANTTNDKAVKPPKKSPPPRKSNQPTPPQKSVKPPKKETPSPLT